MKKFLPVFLLFLCIFIFGCPQAKGAGSGAEKPLPLTVENLAGKWVLESDASVWCEFKTDGSCTSANFTGDHFEIEDGKVKLYKMRSSTKYYGDTLIVELYKNKAFINSKQYNRQ